MALKPVLPERQFIERLRRIAVKARAQEVIHGIGDDCALLQIATGRQLLVTTDLCIEDVHFRREWHPAQSVGHRCLARGLSDIAAMGGDPVACFLSLGVPSSLPQAWVDQFLRGLLDLARRFHITLAGGDTSTAGKITADIVVLGTVATGTALLRSGAHAGDAIYVTGELGHAALVLEQLFTGKKIRPKQDDRHFYPLPRIEIGRRLRQGELATAMIDLSDGLSVDLAHICEESRVTALLEAGAIPVAKNATRELALHGGDDYELVFTAPSRARIPARIAGVPITRIGTIVRSSRGRVQVLVREESGGTRPLIAKGWQHFT